MEQEYTHWEIPLRAYIEGRENNYTTKEQDMYILSCIKKELDERKCPYRNPTIKHAAFNNLVLHIDSPVIDEKLMDMLDVKYPKQKFYLPLQLKTVDSFRISCFKLGFTFIQGDVLLRKGKVKLANIIKEATGRSCEVLDDHISIVDKDITWSTRYTLHKTLVELKEIKLYLKIIQFFPLPDTIKYNNTNIEIKELNNYKEFDVVIIDYISNNYRTEVSCNALKTLYSIYVCELEYDKSSKVLSILSMEYPDIDRKVQESHIKDLRRLLK